jgi:Protein of unknown function (DUF3460)
MMNKAYTSEYESFIDQFLKQHPEIVEEQQRNWCTYWEVKIDPETAHVRKEDLVPDDQYGFRWHTGRPH